MPTDKMKEVGNPSPWVEVEKNIWFLGRPVRGWSERRDPGYYFEDETADVNGPFKTQTEAKQAFESYCRNELKLQELA